MEDTPLVVAVTGAAGQIGYQLVPLIASGSVFPGKKIDLRLLEIKEEFLTGSIMEIDDCAYESLTNVTGTADPLVAFKDADVAIFVGGMPRKEGMERKDLLDANISIFKKQGEALEAVAKRTVKSLVVANPANTNCLALWKATTMPRENFTALTRLDHNRALTQIAQAEGATNVSDVIIWGNHSKTQFPDVRFVKADGKPVSEDKTDFYRGDFINTVQTRGAAVIKARGMSSAMSAAKAVGDHMRDWFAGAEGYQSMAVIPPVGTYGIDTDLCFSFPIKCKGNFEYEVVEGLELDDFAKEKFAATLEELKEEKTTGEIA